MNCIVCGGATCTGVIHWHQTCMRCHYETASLQPCINDAGVHALVDESLREVSLRPLREDNFARIVGRLAMLAPPGARVLDVGSAHGWFLRQASGRFQVLGIEPDAMVGGRAAASGVPVRLGYFPDALQEGERFDAIVFNDVIEHIPDIAAVLCACRERLVEGGVLLLNLPSSGGCFYRVAKLLARMRINGPFERMWQKGLPSPHLHYFNEHNLSVLALTHGFDKLDSFRLPSVRARGLLARMKTVGGNSGLELYLQYFVLLCAMPLIGLMPRDIMVCVFRKQAR